MACVVVCAPLVAALAGLAAEGPAWDHVASTVLGAYIFNTLVLAGAVGALCILLAVPAAWLVATCDFPGRAVFRWALVLPLAVPTYVAAFAFYKVPEAAIPLLLAIREAWGMEWFQAAEAGLRYGLLAASMAGVLYPYLYLAASVSFAQQRRAVLEAAQTLGRPPTDVFFTVALPLARPALVAGLSLVIMEVLNDYGAVHLFGVPTLTEGIFRTWFGLGDRTTALRIAGLVTAAVLIVLLVERLHRGRARFSEEAGASHPLQLRRLRGGTAFGAAVVCGMPLAVGLFYPVLQLAVWAWQTADTAAFMDFYTRTLHSASLALGAASGIAAIASFLVFTARMDGASWLRGAIRFANLGYAIPGAVVAVGVMTLFGQLDNFTHEIAATLPLLSGTLGAIAFAYAVRFLAVAHHPIRAGAERVCGQLDNISRALGHGPAATFLRVDWPLLRRTVLAAAVLVFVDILKELPLTMILRPANFETLATVAFGLAKEGRIQECSIPSLTIVVMSAAALAVCAPFLASNIRDPNAAKPSP